MRWPCEVAVTLSAAGLLLLAVAAVSGPASAHHRAWHKPKPSPMSTETPTPTSAETATSASLPKMGMWSNPQYWGSLSWSTRHANAETQFGIFQGHWRQFKTPSSDGRLSSSEEAAINAGHGFFSNWKVAGSGTWAQTAAGARDAVIVAAAQDWAATCPDTGACWITFHHEPENDIGGSGSGMTAADYVAMQQHVVPLWRQYAPEVKVVWTMAGSDSKQWLFPSLWPGDAYADYIGHDPYIRAGDPPAELAGKMVDRSNWFRSNISMKPVVLPEWGTDLGGVRGTVQHRADAIAGITARLQEIADAGVIELDHFNSREHYISTTDLTGVDAQTYKVLKTATES